jgi:type IX secretion system PorP/SprF family membrane protein
MTPLRLLALCWCLAGTLGAQQLSLFTQYRENATIINPAAMENDFLAAGYNMSVGATYRRQWVGFSGSPQTQSLRFSYINPRITGATFTVGGQLINDQTGPTGLTGVYGRIGTVISGDPEYSGLSLALSGGMVQYRVDASEINLREAGDVVGSTDQQQLHPDVGAGIYYYQTIDGGALDGNIFYIGASMPQLLGMDLLFQNDAGEFNVQRVQHLYGMMGLYTFFYDDSFLQTDLWVKQVDGAPINVDLNLRYQLPNALWIGAGISSAQNFRFETGVNLGNNAGLDSNVKIGYGLDYSFSSFGPTAGATHELQVALAFER